MTRTILFLIASCSLSGADYYVKTNGNNASAGTSWATAWSTLAKLQTNVTAGDIGHIVGPGAFEEVLTPANSGATNNFANYLFESNSVVRQINVTSKDFVQIVGQGDTNVVHVVNTNTAFSGTGIKLYSTKFCRLIDMNVNRVGGGGIEIRFSNPGLANILRGNYIANCGMADDGVLEDNGGANIYMWGTNNLAEYNYLSRGSDFHSMAGLRNIAWHSDLRDIQDAYYRLDTGGPHCDYIELSPSDGDLDDKYNVFMFNNCESNDVSNAHGMLNRDISALQTNVGVIYAMNVIHSINSYLVICETPEARIYNNSFVDGPHANTDSPFDIDRGAQPGTLAMLQSTLNNLFYEPNPLGSRVTYTNLWAGDLATRGYPDYDLLYTTHGIKMIEGSPATTATEAHQVTGDPLFNGYSTHDYSLASGSPARNAARAQTTANGSGSTSTTLIVNDATYFTDGANVTAGVKIIVGSNAANRITAISGNTITLTTPISWSNSDSVLLEGSTDIGGLQYRSGGYSFSGTWTNAGGGTTYTCTPSDSSLVRMVVYYVDKIPRNPVYDAPYSDTITSGTVTAVKMYPAYASAILWTDATFAGGSGPSLVSATIAGGGQVIAMVYTEAIVAGAGGTDGNTLTLSGGAVTMTYNMGTGTTSILYTLDRTVNAGETGTTGYTQPGNGWKSFSDSTEVGSYSGFPVINNSTQGGTAVPPSRQIRITARRR